MILELLGMPTWQRAEQVGQMSLILLVRFPRSNFIEYICTVLGV